MFWWKVALFVLGCFFVFLGIRAWKEGVGDYDDRSASVYAISFGAILIVFSICFALSVFRYPIACFFLIAVMWMGIVLIVEGIGKWRSGWNGNRKSDYLFAFLLTCFGIAFILFVIYLGWSCFQEGILVIDFVLKF